MLLLGPKLLLATMGLEYKRSGNEDRNFSECQLPEGYELSAAKGNKTCLLSRGLRSQ